MKKIAKIAFIGMGLINSSLVRDLREKNFYQKSIAYSRTKKTRDILKKLKIVDKVEDNYKNTVRDADIIVVGVPVEAFSSVIKSVGSFLSRADRFINGFRKDITIINLEENIKIRNNINSIISNRD